MSTNTSTATYNESELQSIFDSIVRDARRGETQTPHLHDFVTVALDLGVIESCTLQNPRFSAKLQCGMLWNLYGETIDMGEDEHMKYNTPQIVDFVIEFVGLSKLHRTTTALWNQPKEFQETSTFREVTTVVQQAPSTQNIQRSGPMLARIHTACLLILAIMKDEKATSWAQKELVKSIPKDRNDALENDEKLALAAFDKVLKFLIRNKPETAKVMKCVADCQNHLLPNNDSISPSPSNEDPTPSSETIMIEAINHISALSQCIVTCSIANNHRASFVDHALKLVIADCAKIGGLEAYASMISSPSSSSQQIVAQNVGGPVKTGSSLREEYAMASSSSSSSQIVSANIRYSVTDCRAWNTLINAIPAMVSMHEECLKPQAKSEKPTRFQSAIPDVIELYLNASLPNHAIDRRGEQEAYNDDVLDPSDAPTGLSEQEMDDHFEYFIQTRSDTFCSNIIDLLKYVTVTPLPFCEKTDAITTLASEALPDKVADISKKWMECTKPYMKVFITLSIDLKVELQCYEKMHAGIEMYDEEFTVADVLYSLIHEKPKTSRRKLLELAGLLQERLPPLIQRIPLMERVSLILDTVGESRLDGSLGDASNATSAEFEAFTQIVTLFTKLCGVSRSAVEYLRWKNERMAKGILKITSSLIGKQVTNLLDVVLDKMSETVSDTRITIIGLHRSMQCVSDMTTYLTQSGITKEFEGENLVVSAMNSIQGVLPAREEGEVIPAQLEEQYDNLDSYVNYNDEYGLLLSEDENEISVDQFINGITIMDDEDDAEAKRRIAILNRKMDVSSGSGKVAF